MSGGKGVKHLVTMLPLTVLGALEVVVLLLPTVGGCPQAPRGYGYQGGFQG